jgi:hypothetical protein
MKPNGTDDRGNAIYFGLTDGTEVTAGQFAAACIRDLQAQITALESRCKELEAEKESLGNEFNAVIIMKDRCEKFKAALEEIEAKSIDSGALRIARKVLKE